MIHCPTWHAALLLSSKQVESSPQSGSWLYYCLSAVWAQQSGDTDSERERHTYTPENPNRCQVLHTFTYTYMHTHICMYILKLLSHNYYTPTLHILTCTLTHTNAHSYTHTTHMYNTNSHTEHTKFIYNCMYPFTHLHTYATQIKHSQDWHTFIHTCHSHALYTLTHSYTAHAVFMIYIHIHTHIAHIHHGIYTVNKLSDIWEDIGKTTY